jgi:hypothetical protein
MKEIGERLARIETIVERLDHQMLGNGQPGVIAQHDARLTSLETSRAKLAGGVTAVSLVAGFIADSVRHWVSGGKG